MAILIDKLGETTAIDLPVDPPLRLARSFELWFAADIQSFQEIAGACVVVGTVASWRLSPISEHIYTRASRQRAVRGR